MLLEGNGRPFNRIPPTLQDIPGSFVTLQDEPPESQVNSSRHFLAEGQAADLFTQKDGFPSSILTMDP